MYQEFMNSCMYAHVVFFFVHFIAVYRTYPRSHYDDRKVTKKNSKVHGVGHSSSSGLATSNSSTESLSPKTSMELAMQKLASLNVSGGTSYTMCSEVWFARCLSLKFFISVLVCMLATISIISKSHFVEI